MPSDTSHHIELTYDPTVHDLLDDADERADCSVFADLAEAATLEINTTPDGTAPKYALDAVISPTGIAEIREFADSNDDIASFCNALDEVAEPMESTQMVTEISLDGSDVHERHAFPRDYDPTNEADSISEDAAEQADDALTSFVEKFR